MTASLPCPQCGREVRWSSEFPFRPFCSERCKLIDLGEWFGSGRAIPSAETDAATDEATDVEDL